MQHVEPAVALHVEYEIELARFFVGEHVAAFHSGRMQQDVNASATLAHRLNDLRHRFGIGEVHTEVVRGTARRAHRINRALCGLRPFQSR